MKVYDSNLKSRLLTQNSNIFTMTPQTRSHHPNQTLLILIPLKGVTVRLSETQ